MNEKNNNVASDIVKVERKKYISDINDNSEQEQSDYSVSDTNLNVYQDEEAKGISIEILGSGGIKS